MTGTTNMKIPVITGIIRRRILLNYRVDPDAIKSILPTNFRPKLFKGYSIAGICLIRLEHIRPKGLPAFIGISSENSAHRIAVEWDDDCGNNQEGVFVPRRDTDSRLNALAGGRIFPGFHYHSNFKVTDQDGRISMGVSGSDADSPLIEFTASKSDDLPKESVFESLQESSCFFEAGSIGYSPRPGSCLLDGLLLRVPEWTVTPLEIDEIHSSYYDESSVFPSESIRFDHALLMRDTSHEWHSQPEMVTEKGKC